MGMARTDLAIYYKANRVPSVKTLKALTNELIVIAQIRAVLTGEADLMQIEASRKRQNEAYHSHAPSTLALEALNEILGTYGVEYVAHKDDGYRVGEQKGFSFLNTGDTYSTTLLYNHDTDSWSIGSWGDRVEAHPNWYN